MSISLSTTKSLIINALLFIDLTLRRQTSIIRELKCDSLVIIIIINLLLI